MEIHMKKSIVALAVLGAFSGAALAQSSVTLYGILDVNYMWQELPTTVGTGTAARVQQESVSAINGGHQFGNRWGLRGSEDIGGGLKAIFTLESGFNIDSGTSGQGGRLFGRQAWAGLSGGWGDVVGGRIATFSSGTGSWDMFSRVDPFGTGFGLASLGNTFISANALRVDNAVLYRSPKIGGFQGGIGYSTRIDGGETAPSDTNVKLFFSGANFEYGPFYAVITYDSADNVAGRPDQKNLQIGGTFNIGPFRLHAGYADQSDIGAVSALVTASGNSQLIPLPAGIPAFDASAYMLGATWNIGAFALLASYQSFNADGQNVRVGTSLVNFDPDYTVYGIGGTYTLSRRTNLYASYAARDANGTLLDNSFNAKQFAVGIAHRF
jgi:predicted porin